jgi:hypothetical protein
LKKPSAVLAAAALASAAHAGAALAHSVEPGRPANWDPPVGAPAQRDAPDPVNAFRYVIDRYKLWPTGSALRVCFFEGDAELRRFVAEAAGEWVAASANLTLDFGNDAASRSCDPGQPAHIRVAFRAGGDWSYVGRDSVAVDLREPSMNLGVAAGRPLSVLDRGEVRRVVLHEFGHALGLQHEHQSPVSGCERQFDWPMVYAQMAGPPNSWTRQTVDLNLRPLLASPRLRTSEYDRASIMHYALPSWMFRGGQQSPCFVSPNRELSALDRRAAGLAYPRSEAEQHRYLDALDVSTREILRGAAPEVAKAVEEQINGAAAGAGFPARSVVQVSGTATTHGAQSPASLSGRDTVIHYGGAPPAPGASPATPPRR